MILEPTLLRTDSHASNIPVSALRAIATTEDTLELSKQETEAAVSAPAKINKWHEKFAKGRATNKGKD